MAIIYMFCSSGVSRAIHMYKYYLEGGVRNCSQERKAAALNALLRLPPASKFLFSHFHRHHHYHCHQYCPNFGKVHFVSGAPAYIRNDWNALFISLGHSCFFIKLTSFSFSRHAAHSIASFQRDGLSYYRWVRVVFGASHESCFIFVPCIQTRPNQL